MRRPKQGRRAKASQLLLDSRLLGWGTPLGVIAARIIPATDVSSADLRLVPAGESAAKVPPSTSGTSSAPGFASPPRSAPVSSAQSAPEPPKKSAYPAPSTTATQEGPNGLRFDFNHGCRLALPDSEYPWRVRLSDIDSGNILYQGELKSGSLRSGKRYFVRYRIEVAQRGKSVFRHEYSASGREVLAQFPLGTLGDPLGWFPYAVKFKEQHSCRLTCAMSDKLIALLRDTHPDIAFVTHEEVRPERYYATYNLGLFFDDKDCVWQPCDFRHVGLHRTAGYILGVDPEETPPRIRVPPDDAGRPLPEPYVCIAVQSTTQCKYWNNPRGWREIVGFLKSSGYRVVCIDQRPVHGHGLVWNHIPHGAEDETGDRPLAERARWLRHGEFFIGLSSGLSWLAWSLGVPVVMISGFTHPTN